MSGTADYICAVEKIKGAKETAKNGDGGEDDIGPLGTPEAMAIEPARSCRLIERRHTQFYFSLARRDLA